MLDVGCTSHEVDLDSPRWVHGRLRKKFEHIEGLDINRENVELLRSRGFDRIHVQSAEDFELESKFDTIVAGELIEHLSNPGRFLSRCYEHLGDGGRVVLTTPNVFGLSFSLYALVNQPMTCQNPEHTVWFCRQTLAELARREGFEVRELELFADYDLTAGSWLYRAYGRVHRALGFLLPELLRSTTMLFVLEKAPS